MNETFQDALLIVAAFAFTVLIAAVIVGINWCLEKTVKTKSMKKLILLVGLVALCASVNAQTPADVLEAIPAASLANESFSVAVGSTMKGAAKAFESELSLRYDVWKHLGLAVNLQSGKGSTSIDTAGVFVQVRKAWDTAELYGLAGVRWSWEASKPEAVAGIGATYSPATSGLLSKFKLVLEERIVGSELRTRPVIETFTGIRYSF